MHMINCCYYYYRVTLTDNYAPYAARARRTNIIIIVVYDISRVHERLRRRTLFLPLLLLRVCRCDVTRALEYSKNQNV